MWYRMVSDGILMSWQYNGYEVIRQTISSGGGISDPRSGPYFIKVKIILSLRFKINLIFYLIKEFMKISCVNFCYEIVNKIGI